tara:strand:+ start:5299 stop:5772 length:474 start_codon:yes stop_codon:yes gene_type:complete
MRQGKQTRCPKKDDDYSTPIEAFELLFEFIPRDKWVWSPFFMNGADLNMPKDIQIIHEHRDFFDYQPHNFEFIVDNPPYSLKKEIFKRCETIGKPYALLVPFDSLERQYLNETMRTRDVTVIIPRKRYKFNDNKVTMPFKSVWICVGFNLGKQLIFE